MNIDAELQIIYDELYEEYGDHLVGVYLFGSQNYGYDTEESDIDCYAIITPFFEEIALGFAPMTEERKRANGTTTVKDYRLFLELLMKQNPTAMEIIQTQYSITNSAYEQYFSALRENVDTLLEVDPKRFLAALKGYFTQPYRKMLAAKPDTPDWYKKFARTAFILGTLCYYKKFRIYDLAHMREKEDWRALRENTASEEVKQMWTTAIESYIANMHKDTDTIECSAEKQVEASLFCNIWGISLLKHSLNIEEP